jgi:PII-like signaling protein
LKLEGKAKLLRIHFGEDDRYKGKPLYQAIVEKCRELGLAGATVYRGIEGYGASTLICKSRLLTFSSDAPITVTVVDTEDAIRRLLPFLDQVVDEGLIVMSDVEVIRYVHQQGAAEWLADPRKHHICQRLADVGTFTHASADIIHRRIPRSSVHKEERDAADACAPNGPALRVRGPAL